MDTVRSVQLVGRQISDLAIGGAPGVAHASLEITFADGRRERLEAGPRHGELVPCDYHDDAPPLFDVPIAAPHGVSLDTFVDRIERGEQRFATRSPPYSYLPPFARNSNAFVSGLLRHAGADVDTIVRSVDAHIGHVQPLPDVPLVLPLVVTPGLGHPLDDRYF